MQRFTRAKTPFLMGNVGNETHEYRCQYSLSKVVRFEIRRLFRGHRWIFLVMKESTAPAEPHSIAFTELQETFKTLKSS
jgi:hypothetical protein